MLSFSPSPAGGQWRRKAAEAIMSLKILTLLLITSSAAIAQTAEPDSQRQQSVPEPRTASEILQRSGGSLLKATLNATPDPGQAKLSKVSFFAVPTPEPRTLKKHDLVTIIVREQSQFNSKGKTDLKKEASLDARIDEFIKFDVSNVSFNNNVGTAPQIKVSGERDYKGEGTVDRQDSLTMRIQAEVIDVKPNGTLVLQARKRIKTDEEEQAIVLSGICRAEDVLADNTVLSTQLFDMDVAKTHKGAVRDSTKRGWLPKLLDVINPF